MIRFLLKRRVREPYHDSCESDVSYETLEVEVPELEALLTRGGFGNGGYDFTVLVGTVDSATDRRLP